MDSLDNLLSRRLNKIGLNKELQAAYVLSQVNSLADGRFQAIRFSRGILTLNCSNSIRAQELQFESEKLVTQINEKITPQKVTRLQYKITK